MNNEKISLKKRPVHKMNIRKTGMFYHSESSIHLFRHQLIDTNESSLITNGVQFVSGHIWIEENSIHFDQVVCVHWWSTNFFVRR